MEERDLREADALASAWIEAARPLELRAADEAARADALRLRFEAVVAAGWSAAADFPDGLERDSHDEGATLVVAVAGGVVVATARVVPPRPGRRLPVETVFDLDLGPATAEVDRVVVAHSHRDRGHGILAGLLGRSWQELRALGCRNIAGIASQAMVALYGELGIVFELLGPARRYWNEDRFPVRLDLAATVGRRVTT